MPEPGRFDIISVWGHEGARLRWLSDPGVSGRVLECLEL